MQKKIYSTISRVFTVTVLLAMLIIAVIPVATLAAENAVTTGVVDTTDPVATVIGRNGNYPYFKEDTYYDLSTAIDTPLTYEFEVSACGNIGSVSGGIVFGNYGKDRTSCVSIEFYEYGAIRFYVNNKAGYVADIKFSSANHDHRKNDIIHYAITVDPNAKTVSLYANGVLKQTVEHSNLTNLPSASDFPYNFRIGGDHRSGNTKHFEGVIHSLALYSDIRTPEEIAQDANKTKTWSGSTDNLIAASSPPTRMPLHSWGQVLTPSSAPDPAAGWWAVMSLP